MHKVAENSVHLGLLPSCARQTVRCAVVAAVVCVDAELPHPVDITTAAAAAKNKTLHCFFIIKFLLVNKKIYLFIV